MRLPEGVFIRDKDQAQMYLQTDAKRAAAEDKRADAEKMRAQNDAKRADNDAKRADAEKMKADKMESLENNAQRAHELKMKDVRKLELKVELAKLQAQNPTTPPTKKAKAGVGKPKTKKRQTPQQIEYNRKRREKYAADKQMRAEQKQNAMDDL
jgi:hypothetical protein